MYWGEERYLNGKLGDLRDASVREELDPFEDYRIKRKKRNQEIFSPQRMHQQVLVVDWWSYSKRPGRNHGK